MNQKNSSTQNTLNRRDSVHALQHNSHEPLNKHKDPSSPSIVVGLKEVAAKSELRELSENATFSENPIPSELLFEGCEKYLIKLPKIAYYDEKYACRKLLSRTLLCVGVINKTKRAIDNLISQTQRKLSDTYSRYLTPHKQTKTAENADLWRKRVIVFWKQTKYLKRIYLERLQRCYGYIAELEKLELICQELIKHPRYLIINETIVSSLIASVKNEADSLTSLRLNAIDLMLNDIKTEMTFIPKATITFETWAQSLKNVIESSCRCIDPVTSFLSITQDAYSFRDIIQSRYSPIKPLEKIPMSIEKYIQETIQTGRKIAKITDKEEIHVFSLMTARFWFNKTLECNNFYAKSDNTLIFYLNSIRNRPISELKPPKVFIKSGKINIEISSKEYVEKEKLMSQALESFFNLCFISSPLDIAFDIYVIDLRMLGIAYSILKKDISDKISTEFSTFLWKILIINTENPLVDVIFEFVNYYAKLACIPPQIMKRVKIPLEIVRQLKHDANKAHFSK